MKFAFRTDASTQIGTGHVMRCLTLANALREKGGQCIFICREHPGNLINQIRSQGHAVHSLPIGTDVSADIAYNNWLGATQAQDAQACELILANVQPDWLVVDHYALDSQWENALSKCCGKVMVIDDLADRPHSCQILLDQTFGRNIEDYRLLVPADCISLCGSNYVLLRPEFAELREYSIKRRVQPQLKHILVSMGGVDKDNVTSQVLNALRDSPLPADCKITVVMGATAPWLVDVQKHVQSMPFYTMVYVGVDNMAQLMADSDLAIGAAGSTTWERCFLGLPTILLVLAENQTTVAESLAKTGAARVVELNNETSRIISDLITEFCRSASDLTHISQASSRIVDGQGLRNVVEILGA